jgi:hypothetical protein
MVLVSFCNSHDRTEHAQAKSPALTKSQTTRFDRIKRTLIPAAACVLLAVREHIPVLKAGKSA